MGDKDLYCTKKEKKKKNGPHENMPIVMLNLK